MAAQNKLNFALLTCNSQKFSMSSLATFSILTNQINDWFRLCCLCLSREYYAIDTMQDRYRKLKAKILENRGMVE